MAHKASNTLKSGIGRKSGDSASPESESLLNGNLDVFGGSFRGISPLLKKRVRGSRKELGWRTLKAVDDALRSF